MATDISLVVKLAPEQKFMWERLGVIANVISKEEMEAVFPGQDLPAVTATMCGIPILEDEKVPVDVVRIESNGKLVVEVFNLALPVNFEAVTAK